MQPPSPAMNDAGARLERGILMVHGSAVLTGVPEHLTLVDDPLEVGVYLHASAPTAAAKHQFTLGAFAQLRRFTCCYRCDPWWVTSVAGDRGCEVPVETQYLLAELADGRVAVLLLLLDGPFYTMLCGADDDTLVLTAETGDPAVVGAEVTGLFIAVGDDPYALMEAAAQSVTARMGCGRLHREKPLPDFVDDFGWCTWDAFYQDVSHAKVREGLESFAAGGVSPRFLILDDGWLSARVMETGESRLTSFAANAEKFPGDLGATVAMAKGEFDIETFLVWHTLQGYWGGVDGEALPHYRVSGTEKHFSAGILQHTPEITTMFGRIVGLLAPEDSYRFFHDFHRHLREQGVDGVKVDNQGSLDAVTHGHGGLISLVRAYHEALEGAAQTHFFGRLINCMSVSTNVVYHALNSTLIRSSTDFWPTIPASHGLHLYTNAQSSFWLGEFMHPDWDMFQSDHAMGAFHAAGRAVSGSPLYVSDKPDGHDFALLRKLVLSDGTILRAREIGRPTRDCLFHNPTKEDVLLKIFNHDERAGVLGVFNARYHAEEAERVTLSGQVCPADVEGLAGERFASYAHNAQTLTCGVRDAALPVTLPELTFEIFTIVPIEHGVAPIGLTDKFNSAGAITAKDADPRGGYFLALRDGGDFLAWCAETPSEVRVDDAPVPFNYDAATGALRVTVSPGGPHVVRIV